MQTRFPIHGLLRDAHVDYAVLPNRSAFTAQDETPDQHVRNRAKVVMYVVDDDAVEALLPASMTVNLERLLDLARGRAIRLARPDELQRLFSESDLGVTSPSEPPYRPSVIVDVALAAETEILFNADVPADTIRIRWADFAARVRPIVGKFAERPPDRVGAFRLSYRE
jgi:prolyl-tRNA editing enzyme YbaK/EbsC (Cys-tRNA(Pro) deacylase)